MSEKRMTEINIIDDDHIYIEGRQFISLRRFLENKSELAEEYKLIVDDNTRLVEENNHLRALLKEAL